MLNAVGTPCLFSLPRAMFTSRSHMDLMLQITPAERQAAYCVTVTMSITSDDVVQPLSCTALYPHSCLLDKLGI